MSRRNPEVLVSNAIVKSLMSWIFILMTSWVCHEVWIFKYACHFLSLYIFVLFLSFVFCACLSFACTPLHKTLKHAPVIIFWNSGGSSGCMCVKCVWLCECVLFKLVLYVFVEFFTHLFLLQAPSSLLEALEQHLASLEGKKTKELSADNRYETLQI